MDEGTVSPAPNPAPNADERLERLERQYAASSQEGKRLAQENQQLKAILEQQQAPRPDLPQRAGAREQLEQLGVPPGPIEELVKEWANENIMKPLQRHAEVRTRMQSQYPDYTKFESEMMNYVNSDPELSTEYNRSFGASPLVAVQWAMDRYAEHQKKTLKAEPSPGNGANGAVEAQLPGTRSGDARRAQNPDSEVEETFARYQKTGSAVDRVAFAKARLRQVIPDSFLNI